MKTLPLLLLILLLAASCTTGKIHSQAIGDILLAFYPLAVPEEEMGNFNNELNGLNLFDWDTKEVPSAEGYSIDQGTAQLIVRTTQEKHMHIRQLLIKCKSEPPPATYVPTEDEREFVRKLPTITRHYTPRTAVIAANKFIQMGEERAYALLRMSNLEAVAIFSALLYRYESKSPFRSMALGAPDIPYWSMNDLKGWSCIPLVISNEVPFLVVTGYVLRGLPEGPRYLWECRKNCTFRKKLYSVPSAEEAQKAMTALFSSERWKNIEWSITKPWCNITIKKVDLKNRIIEQIERMKTKEESNKSGQPARK